MDTSKPRCQAITKAGTPCKNTAQPGSSFCAVHLRAGAAQATAAQPEAATSPVPAATPPKPAAPDGLGEASTDLLLQELEALAREIQRRMNIEPMSPAQVVGLFNKSVGRFAPEVPREVLRDLERNLEGSSFKDLVDPETLKGLWYVMSYSVQGASQATRQRIYAQLSALPGFEALADLAGNLEGATPRDLVDPATWKGFWYILNHTAQQQLASAKRRVLGPRDPADS